jgi:hypothetical protein
MKNSIASAVGVGRKVMGVEAILRGSMFCPRLIQAVQVTKCNDRVIE